MSIETLLTSQKEVLQLEIIKDSKDFESTFSVLSKDPISELRNALFYKY